MFFFSTWPWFLTDFLIYNFCLEFLLCSLICSVPPPRGNVPSGPACLPVCSVTENMWNSLDLKPLGIYPVASCIRGSIQKLNFNLRKSNTRKLLLTLVHAQVPRGCCGEPLAGRGEGGGAPGQGLGLLPAGGCHNLYRQPHSLGSCKNLIIYPLGLDIG